MTRDAVRNETEPGGQVLIQTLARVEAIAFDCYGTLMDFGEQHFVDLMDEVCLREELGVAGVHLWKRWIEHSKELWRARGRDPEHPTAGPEPEFGTYYELWPEQFERSFQELDRSGDAVAACELLVDRVRQARPFPEVHDVLGELLPHYRLCVVSNADDSWLDSCLPSAGLEFECVISSESARSYKPRRKIFHDAAHRLKLRPEQVLYVGDSPAADVLGAHHAGMPVAWLNRYGATLPPDVPRPDLEVKDLRELVAPLLAAVANRKDG